MPLVNLGEILRDASSGGYAIGMFDAVNTETLKAIIGGAEECDSPVILALAEVHFPYAPLEMMAPIMVDAARRSSVPVAVHLDHGINYGSILKSIHLGFSSVMFDGSSLSYEANIEKTREVVKSAKVFGVSVEAELGHVGGAEAGDSDDHPEFYTDPELADDFVVRTGIDALAVAIGTAHGEYIRKPRLDFNRLASIRNKVGVPLVLHGGSGLTDSDFRECIRCGIRKINIFTEMSYAAAEGAKKLIEEKGKVHCFELSEAIELKMKEIVVDKIRLFRGL
jgi:fructose-bisphosphate aldolase, class II